ncbi:helix-turn-helix domain-containing protein [Nonomuraea sp. NPDC004702]
MPAGGAEPVVVPADLWQRPDMVSALATRDLGHVFRLVRRYAGVSQTRIGVAVGLSQGKVSQIMKGTIQVVSFEVFERVAEGLRMPDPARMTLGLAPGVITGVPLPGPPMPARDGTPASAPPSVEGVGQLVLGPRQPSDVHEIHEIHDVDALTLAWVAGRLDTHMDRRTMLLLAAGMTAEAATSIASPWQRWPRALSGPQTLSEDTIELLEARTIGFHRLEYILPARAIQQGLTTHITQLDDLLQSGPPDRFRRRLAATAGEASTLAAWIAWDLKQPAQRAASRRVSALAKESGHAVIQACLYAYKSYALQGVSALKAIQRAKTYLPPHGDNATRAWLLSREAEELAALGDHGAIQLLRQAEEAFDHAQPHRERAWTRFLDTERMTAFRLSTHLLLGQERHALQAGQSALDSIGHDTSHKRAAIIYTDMAKAQFQLGDITEAITHARRALDTARRAESTWGLQHLATIEKTLAGQRDPSARELLGDLIATRRDTGPPPG